MKSFLDYFKEHITDKLRVEEDDRAHHKATLAREMEVSCLRVGFSVNGNTRRHSSAPHVFYKLIIHIGMNNYNYSLHTL